MTLGLSLQFFDEVLKLLREGLQTAPLAPDVVLAWATSSSFEPAHILEVVASFLKSLGRGWVQRDSAWLEGTNSDEHKFATRPDYN